MANAPYSGRILQLAEKWTNNSITDTERTEFITWYNSFNDAELLWPGNETIKDDLLAHISAHIQKKNPAPVINIRKLKIVASIAAAMAVILLAINYFNSASVATGKKIISSTTVMPAPGSDKATLILSNGQQIELNNQAVINDGENKISNRKNELIYENITTLSFNTMITPRGGQYKLQLPDGSRVWLNAESRIVYPTMFTGNERQVSVEGEVYFEIAKNKEKPFIVNSKSGTIKVLGTRFNINDYPNEQFRTTLLDGSVKVNDKIIAVGEAYTKGKIMAVDTSEIVAWKNGYFSFNKTDIQVVLRQLQRWYDLDIEYEGEVPQKTFVGELSRSAPLEQVLRILSKTGLVFVMEGKKMIVRKQ